MPITPEQQKTVEGAIDKINDAVTPLITARDDLHSMISTSADSGSDAFSVSKMDRITNRAKGFAQGLVTAFS